MSTNDCGFRRSRPGIPILDNSSTASERSSAVKWMRSDNPKASLHAIQILLDRGHGKALQAHEISGRDGGPMQVLDHGVIEDARRWFESRRAELGLPPPR